MVERYVKFGLSTIILYKEMLSGPYGELEALTKASRLKNYEVLETFLSDDESLRKEELRMIWGEGKTVTYNSRSFYQVPGKYNILSLDDKEASRGIDLMKKQLDFAAEAASPKFLITSGPDYLPEKRDEVKKRYVQSLCILSEYAKKLNIEICLEPTERHRFKKQLLGPTTECISFIDDLHKNYGCENVCLMIDTAHCPLMEEDPVEDIKLIGAQKLGYVHIGDAVLNPESEFYGHTHPPVSIIGGCVDVNGLSKQFKALFDCGYLKKSVSYDARPNISYEMACYPGVSPETSALFAYEIAESALSLLIG
ncbi:MAG: sugar phosphate isomerase/epimerase [Sphaerochaetaceae bacterium]|nr:sugar phosphate isomerase/epimerase [Sphaerochaetaceae bacterium]